MNHAAKTTGETPNTTGTANSVPMYTIPFTDLRAGDCADGTNTEIEPKAAKTAGQTREIGD
jgi:hypothetical protein